MGEPPVVPAVKLKAKGAFQFAGGLYQVVEGDFHLGHGQAGKGKVVSHRQIVDGCIHQQLFLPDQFIHFFGAGVQIGGRPCGDFLQSGQFFLRLLLPGVEFGKPLHLISVQVPIG